MASGKQISHVPLDAFITPSFSEGVYSENTTLVVYEKKKNFSLESGTMLIE